MKFSAIFALCLLFPAWSVLAQNAKGPVTGSVAGGGTVTTDNFLASSPVGFPGPLFHEPRNKISPAPVPPPPGATKAARPAGSNEIVDPAAGMTASPLPPVIIDGFPGIPDQGSRIPPDPYVAVGPNHVIAVVNSRFRIWDKAGNLLKTIEADPWFASVLPNSGAFDPKVAYDEHAGRWVMVWLEQSDANKTSHYLLSVSDDSNPLGTWYNWSLPGDVLGSTNDSTWADYEGVGYDDQAIYLTSNQWRFGDGFQFTKFRIIPKAQLYANTAGPVTWTDFWDLRDASNNTVFGVRPTRVYGSEPMYYLVGMPYFTNGSYFVVFGVSDPVTNPAIQAVNIPVTAWAQPPNADQPGGSSILIEAAGDRIRCEPIVKGNSIWLTHNVASTGGYSNVRYVKLDLSSYTATEDVSFGANGFWHFYNALAVDENDNVAITYSRSGTTEYIGAYLTWRLNSDPPGLRPSTSLSAGLAHYVKDFGSSRNRWGDYNGIWTDPADPSNFWTFTEYVQGTNTWGTWLGNVRLVPFPQQYIVGNVRSADFGVVEAGKTSNVVTVTLGNGGASNLTITSISNSQSGIRVQNIPSLPATLGTFDTLGFQFYCQPTAHGQIRDSIVVQSNDPGRPTLKIPVSGFGVVIGQAQPGVLYTAVPAPASSLLSVNSGTGAVTTNGGLGVEALHGLSIRPSTKEMYGTLSTSENTVVYRVSAQFGTVLKYMTFQIPNMRAIAFTATGDTLYGGTTSGKLYRMNVDSGDTTFIGQAPGIAYAALAFSPTSGALWAGVRPGLSGKDKLYTVNTASGAVTLVGAVGNSQINAGLAFSPQGLPYVLTGSGSQVNSLFIVDTLTGKGTLIGSTGQQNLSGLALRSDGSVGVNEQLAQSTVPQVYQLSQNYPNPFNPETRIRVALPFKSQISLVVYDILGQEVTQLANGVFPAGTHSFGWAGLNQKGSPVAGGMYLYRLDAKPLEGSSKNDFVEVKKMILLK